MSRWRRCANTYGGYGLGGYGASRFEERATPFSNTYATPGWQRAQERLCQGRGLRSTAAHHRRRARRARDRRPALIERGARVFHQKFGYGRVTAVDGNKLTIDFDKAGEKRVLDSFVTAA